MIGGEAGVLTRATADSFGASWRGADDILDAIIALIR
jgi:hypothetical protein